MSHSVTVRVATASELPAVLGVLDAANLDTNAERVQSAMDGGDVLVAATGGDSRDEDRDEATLCGALVLDGDEIANVAVRRRRRDQGIGSALVELAATRRERLVAEFDDQARPFYETVGFAVESTETGRYRGRLDASEGEGP